MRTGARAGAAVVGLYLAAAIAMSGRRVLPLFDSIGPTPAYRWVHPPHDQALGNQRPSAADRTAGLRVAVSASTGDGQAVVALGDGAIPAHGTDTAVLLRVTAVAPDGLPPPPAPWRPDGNAYSVGLAYQPSGAEVVPARAGDIVLRVPQRASAVLYRGDDRAWHVQEAQPVGGGGFVGSAFGGPGVYLAVSEGHAQPVGAPRRLSDLVFAALVAAAAVVLVAVARVRRA